MWGLIAGALRADGSWVIQVSEKAPARVAGGGRWWEAVDGPLNVEAPVSRL